MDIARGEAAPGTQVIAWPRTEPTHINQLWYQDEHGFIHSKLNDYVLTEQGKHVCWFYSFISMS